MNTLADSIKRLRERYDGGLSMDSFHAMETINQLVELVAEMRDRVDFLSDLINCNDPDYIVVEETLAKADALLTGLKDGV